MIELTAEEMDSLAQINTLVKIEAESGNDEYFDFRDDGYYTYLRGYGINDELIERLVHVS